MATTMATTAAATTTETTTPMASSKPSKDDKELIQAAKDGDESKVLELIAAGANVEASEEYGYMPLHYVSCQGHVGVAKVLLAHGADVSALDGCGSTALHWAGHFGHAAVAELLIEKGADVNAMGTDHYGHVRTPLHWASLNGHAAAVKLLLAKGADVSAMMNDKDGKTPLHLACFNGHADVVKVMLTDGAKVDTKEKSPDDHAASEDDAAVAEAEVPLADSDVVHLKDKSGWTPLHYACFHGHASVVQVLLAHGADVEGENNEGKTPRDLAGYEPQTRGRAKVIKVLNGEVLASDQPGEGEAESMRSNEETSETPVDGKAKKGNEEVEKWLLELIPSLRKEDVANYRDKLLEEGYDSSEMLDYVEEDDLTFMKKGHKKVLLKKLSQRTGN